jgi:aryl-alcohol dehydrogenase-like predicted oxidoreductase
MRLALGTVQFGLDYGISNTNGKVSTDEVSKILSTAQANNIALLDTGCVYGNSEQVLGEQLAGSNHQFDIIDKIPDLETNGQSITQSIEKSLSLLNVSSIEGLLLHNAADLTDDTYKELQSLKSQGLIKKMGISVYHPKTTFELEKRYELDIVQLPMNLFDQRFVQTGCIDWLKEKGVEIHARSLFLQGLLLMNPRKLSAYFDPYQPLFDRFSAYCKALNISRQVGALTVIHQHQNIDKFVVGVCSQQQLEQVIEAYEKARHVKFNAEPLSCHEEALISPFLWPAER